MPTQGEVTSPVRHGRRSKGERAILGRQALVEGGDQVGDGYADLLHGVAVADGDGVVVQGVEVRVVAHFRLKNHVAEQRTGFRKKSMSSSNSARLTKMVCDLLVAPFHPYCDGSVTLLVVYYDWW